MRSLICQSYDSRINTGSRHSWSTILSKLRLAWNSIPIIKEAKEILMLAIGSTFASSLTDKLLNLFTGFQDHPQILWVILDSTSHRKMAHGSNMCVSSPKSLGCFVTHLANFVSLYFLDFKPCVSFQCWKSLLHFKQQLRVYSNLGPLLKDDMHNN